MAVCKIFSVEHKELKFEDGRRAKGVMITFGAKSAALNDDGTPKVSGYVPFCYATKDGNARCDKFVVEKKLFPKNYIPMAGDMVNIEFELGKSDIVSVTKLDKNNQPVQNIQ